MRRLLSAALCVSLAAAAFASPDDDAAPRVELPLGPYVRAGRPLGVRVIGGADRVRAPGTPWALPLGDRGDEFLLQMPAAVSVPLDLTVERAGRTARVKLDATVLPADGNVVALLGDAAAPAGATGVPVRGGDLPTVGDAWLLFDDVADGSRDPEPRGPEPGPGPGVFDPLLLGPDPELFAATEEAAAASALLDPATSTLLLVLAAGEAALALVLRFRRDRPWVRAAWLSAPPAAAAVLLAWGGATAPLVAVPFAIDGDRKVVYVRVHALRDGTGTLALPRSARGPAAVIRFSADDRSVEEVAAGGEVRLSLRAGESRVFGYRCQHEKRVFVVAPPEATPGPATTRWLASRRLASHAATAAAHPNSRPASADVRVLPGLEVVVDALPTK